MTERNHGADWIKWSAILSMCINHLKWINVYAPISLLFENIGRASFPLFSILVGWNLAKHSKTPSRFVIRLLLAGVLMEPLQFKLISPLIGPTEINPFITLGMGALLALCCLEIQKQGPSILRILQLTGTCTAIYLLAPNPNAKKT